MSSYMPAWRFPNLQIISDDYAMRKQHVQFGQREISDLKPSHRQFHQLPTCGYVDRRDKLFII